jgi:hypothetical protein
MLLPTRQHLALAAAAAGKNRDNRLLQPLKVSQSVSECQISHARHHQIRPSYFTDQQKNNEE